LAEATDLWVEAWARTYPDIDFEARRVWFVERIVDLRDRGATALCAFDAADGRMAGFITLEAGHIDQLAVAVQAWGSGAASVLLSEAKRRCEDLALDVNRDNARAVRFYEREGFRRIGEGASAQSGLGTWRYEWRRTAEISPSS
jgi:putative acetyltransferase